MTAKCRRFIAIVAIAIATGQFVALSTLPAHGQSLNDDGPAWCGTNWACDTVGPTSDPADGKFVALVTAVDGDYVVTGQGSADAARDLARSKCTKREPEVWCDADGPSTTTTTGCIGVAGKKKWTEVIWHDDKSTRVDAWRQALKNCLMRHCQVELTACAGDDPRTLPRFPLPPDVTGGKIDPALVGTWEIPMHPGRWIWEIAANGTYEFHTEAPDGAPSHAGTLSADGGTWSLVSLAGSIAGYADRDEGTYLMQGPDTVEMTGKLGGGTWQRVKGTAPPN
jgi:hypothetical protein